jgi:hypothetical protein
MPYHDENIKEILKQFTKLCWEFTPDMQIKFITKIQFQSECWKNIFQRQEHYNYSVLHICFYLFEESMKATTTHRDWTNSMKIGTTTK